MMREYYVRIHLYVYAQSEEEAYRKCEPLERFLKEHPIEGVEYCEIDGELSQSQPEEE